MSVLIGVLFILSIVGIPAWLLLVGHRLRDRGLRVRGAFWGGVVGHGVGDAALLGLLLAPPLVWPPPEPIWLLALVLFVPSVLGLAIGAAVGRSKPRRHG